MTDYGVTEDGFVPKTYEEIIEDKKVEAKNVFGADIDLTETSPLMMFIEVVALEELRLWEMAEALYYCAFVDYATETNLERVGAIVGIERKSATFATVTVTFNGVNSTVIPLGTVVMTLTGIEFTTDIEDTILGSSVDIACTAKVAGDEGNVSSNTITELQTPITGVTSITNASDAANGTDAETDVTLRDRIKGALSLAAKGTLEAIRQSVLGVSGVTSCSATEDVNEHSALLMVAGISKPDANVDAAIEEVRPAGIKVIWDTPTTVDIYVTVTVTVNGYAPGDAATQVETAIMSYINGLGVGDDVIYKKVVDAIFDCEEDETNAWIVDITNLKTDKVTPPTGEVNITISSNEEAVTDVAKIVETITPV